MKKKELKNLALNKKSISNFFIKGGLDGGNPADASEEARATWVIDGCLSWSVIQNTDCTCA